MPIRSLAAAAIIAASTIAASSAHAQFIDDSFTYQGSLMDNGVPANGLYDIDFFVYDSEVGGNIVPGGFLPLFDVEVVDGLFSVEVDFGTSGSVFDSFEPRYLELHVSEAGQPGTTILAPRQKFVPAPLANFALRSGYANLSGTSLQAAYSNGIGRIVMDSDSGPIQLQGSGSLDPTLELINSIGFTRGTLGYSALSDGGFLNLVGPQGFRFARIEADFSTGGGGFLSLTRNNTNLEGIVLDGNAGGTGNARVSIFGSVNSIWLDTSASADSSVILPSDAISALETLNEPGVAETILSGGLPLTQDNATIDTLSSVTIQAPSDGYVLVIASAELTISHQLNTSSSVNLGVSTTTLAFPTNLDHETRIDSIIPSGSFDYTVSTHAIFPASEGPNTYYFLGDLNNPAPTAATIFDQQLSAVFIPTAYGFANFESMSDLPDEFTPTTHPMTARDIQNEQIRSLQADNERQQRELEEMRAQFEQLKRELDELDR